LHLKPGAFRHETAEQPGRTNMTATEVDMKQHTPIEQLAVAVLASLASVSWLFVFAHSPAVLG
jgi:hypothetical protein